MMNTDLKKSFFLLIGALLLFPFSATCSLIFVFLGVVKCANFFAPRFPLFLKRTIHWIHSIAFEALALIITFCMRPIAYLFPQKGAFGQKEGVPIVLIHGYLHDSSAWLYFKRRLAKKNLGPIYTVNLMRPFRSIKEHAEGLAPLIEKIRQETSQNEVVLIGHSMGGLVASFFATKVATSSTSVITLGSPMNGTWAAQIALGKNGSEMRRGSYFVNEMKTLLQQSNTTFYHMGSLADQVILPPKSAFLGIHPDKEFQLDDLGHMSLLFSSRIINQIAVWLKEGRRMENCVGPQ